MYPLNFDSSTFKAARLLFPEKCLTSSKNRTFVKFFACFKSMYPPQKNIGLAYIPLQLWSIFWRKNRDI